MKTLLVTCALSLAALTACEEQKKAVAEPPKPVPVVAQAPATDESKWEDTKDKSAKAWDATKEAGGSAIEATKDTSAKVWDKTKETSGDAWEATKDTSAKTWDATKEKSGELLDATKSVLNKVGDSVSGDSTAQ